MEVGEMYLRELFFLIIAVSSLHRLSAAKDDAAVMAKVAKSISPTPPGWSGSDPCGWSGVDCDSSGKVTSINLASKSLTGELPSELNQLSSLKSLSLQRNKFSGGFPFLSNLASLQHVLLNSNNFSSVPSPFLTGLTSLQTLNIGENPNLSPWTLPETLADSSNLKTLYAGQSNLKGQMPDIFGSFPSLQNVRLSYNNLTGPLPPSFANSSIQSLLLNNQAVGLSGRIDVLSTMSQLTQVWLHLNQFSGPIPELSACTSLFDLSLRNNRLTGPVPPSLTTLPKLVNVSLQNNKLQGPEPSFPNGVLVTLGTTNSFCNPKPGPCDPQVTTLLEVAGDLSYPMALAESWSGNDPCNGWTCVSCNSKGQVTVLNFGKQGWAGTISPAIANLTSLTKLLLNDNNLTGPIPSALTNLSMLQLFDVSNNNVSGKVPAFGSRVTVKTSGNPFIGVDVPAGDGSSSSRRDRSGNSSGGMNDSSDSSGGNQWVIVVAIIGSVFLVVALAFVIFKCFTKKQSGKYQWVRKEKEKLKKVADGAVKGNGGFGNGLSSQSSVDSSNTNFYDGGNFFFPIDVLREGTENFSEKNILGKGGFGVVYWGQLHDGTEVAVKRMEGVVASSKGLNEFRAEIGVLSKVRHRHLVALYGFCIEGNERLLVYEYMPQGTLAQHLFSYTEMGVSPLTWKQRVTIALDVARGIEYLHSLAQQTFIHRDLKPSNILLGDNMRGKVSDFGLVKNAPDGNKYSVETKLAGTFGYLAPEYAATGRVTTKVDVFAFGVVLMEIITGRKALDESLPEETSHLVTWFRKHLHNKDRIREYLDSTLDPNEETFESICKVTELAGHCTSREPFQRPDMGHAVNVLSPLVEQWKPITRDEEDSIVGTGLCMSLPEVLQKWQESESSSTMTSDYPNGYPSTSTPLGPSGLANSFNSRNGTTKDLKQS